MKRLRIFAEPNGSGKSTLIEYVKQAKVHLGVYVNADDYKKELNTTHIFDFSTCGLEEIDITDFIHEFSQSNLFEIAGGVDLLIHIRIDKTKILILDFYSVNDYFTSFLASYIRNKLLCVCEKFTIETVMSHRYSLVTN